jgi:hypothetical protein
VGQFLVAKVGQFLVAIDRAALALNFHHRTAGFVTGLSRFAAGEAQLLTQQVNLRDEPQSAGGFAVRGSNVARRRGWSGLLGVAFLWPLR